MYRMISGLRSGNRILNQKKHHLHGAFFMQRIGKSSDIFACIIKL